LAEDILEEGGAYSNWS